MKKVFLTFILLVGITCNISAKESIKLIPGTEYRCTIDWWDDDGNHGSTTATSTESMGIACDIAMHHMTTHNSYK